MCSRPGRRVRALCSCRRRSSVLFDPPLLPASFLARRKRFFADIVFPDGTAAVAHLANTGSMHGLLQAGARALVRPARTAGKPAGRWPKLAWGLEALEAEGVFVGVNTLRANALAAEVLRSGRSDVFGPLQDIRAEVALPAGGTRIDFLAHNAQGALWVEVKSVSMAHAGVAQFPDAPTERGRKHLQALTAIARDGGQAALLLLALRSDVHVFTPAVAIDPEWAHLLRVACATGVRVRAVRCSVQASGIDALEALPVTMPA